MVMPRSFPLRSRLWKRLVLVAVIALMVAIALILGTRWQRLTSSLPLTVSATSGNPAKVSLADTESITDIPFWIWVVLPRLFPEKLPGAGGYTSLGLTWERGSELPVGFTKNASGIPRVMLDDPKANIDVQRYTQFLVDCARDPRFNPDFILPEIAYNINLSPWEKLVYRFSAIPKTKKMLLTYARESTTP